MEFAKVWDSFITAEDPEKNVSIILIRLLYDSCITIFKPHKRSMLGYLSRCRDQILKGCRRVVEALNIFFQYTGMHTTAS